MPITDWPEDERPREKLIALGAAALSDAELLAIFLRVGIAGKSAVDLARELVTHFGSLGALFAADVKTLSTIKGMGAAKYTQLQAVLELARRALHEQLTATPLTGGKEVADYLRLTLSHLPHEAFWAFWLDASNHLICAEELARGSLRSVSLHAREVLKAALRVNAAAVIIAHNHPSGAPVPSLEDARLTEQIRAALKLIDVQLHDHLIVARNQVFSCAAETLL